jgi:CheY-like chemotaxis protein
MARICVVGENLTMSRLLGELLEGPHEVQYCDAESAYDTLRQGIFDLIVLDVAWSNPEGGWDVLTFLQLHPTLHKIPVVVCSGPSYELIVKREWLKQRGIGILEKPFELDDLDGHIGTALGHMQNAS